MRRLLLLILRAKKKNIIIPIKKKFYFIIKKYPGIWTMLILLFCFCFFRKGGLKQLNVQVLYFKISAYASKEERLFHKRLLRSRYVLRCVLFERTNGVLRKWH